MKLFRKEMKVVRYKVRATFIQTQQLEQHYFVFGFRVWRKVVDVEEVPVWAVIELSSLGSTNWKSRFASYIDKQNDQSFETAR